MRRALFSTFALLTVTLMLPGFTFAALPYSAEPGVAAAEQARPLAVVIGVAVELGLAALVAGAVLCLYRTLRGPHLADRVLASDTLALHVVGLVVVLAIYMQTTDFLDVALVVAIIGFASTLAFSQYIAARGAGEPGQAESGDAERSQS